MWTLSQLKDDKTFSLALYEDDEGRRRFALVADGDISSVRFLLFESEVVPKELLATRDLRAISKAVRLKNGERFLVDPHGMWFTQAEYDLLMADEEFSKIPWVTGKPPRFAPK